MVDDRKVRYDNMKTFRDEIIDLGDKYPSLDKYVHRAIHNLQYSLFKDITKLRIEIERKP